MNSNPDIDIYDDAWIFLLGGSNSVRSYWLGEDCVAQEVLDAWTQRLHERLVFANSIGAKYVHVVAPEKLSVYPEKTTLNIVDENLPACQIELELKNGLVENSWINPTNFLRSQKQSYLVYSKTDSHWNFYGAYSTYQLIQARLELPINRDILRANSEAQWTVMDLGGKLEPPLKEEVYFYKLSSDVTRVYANDIVVYKEKNRLESEAGLHVGSYVIYQNKSPVVDKTLMIFGDSFAEYRGSLLTGLFAETYREVHFIWSGSLDKGLISKVKPDLIITEFAERFMVAAVPDDNFNVESYCVDRLNSFIKLSERSE